MEFPIKIRNQVGQHLLPLLKHKENIYKLGKKEMFLLITNTTIYAENLKNQDNDVGSNKHSH